MIGRCTLGDGVEDQRAHRVGRVHQRDGGDVANRRSHLVELHHVLIHSFIHSFLFAFSFSFDDGCLCDNDDDDDDDDDGEVGFGVV